ncbi:signal peptidase I [Evansella caseinilytica]|uniref:Signal peptidase I n=1 Tax=Evansella caseinilytica TaxID=1503961 RepID=A0A1H3HA19_9BACI|nr:signal peptidase I [Evansella caseinilytica]SDY12200.1 signal peptidase I [Evansella caseinilytica]
MIVKKFISEIISWSKAIIFALILTVIISVFVIQPYTVDGSSMEPTLHGGDDYGDKVIAFKTPYLLGSSPEFGDIVIVDSKINQSRSLKEVFLESPIITFFTDADTKDRSKWVKRVIGVSGDILEMKDGDIYRNGELLEEEYIKEGMLGTFEKIVVPEDTVYVMGDNRNESKDSRSIGPIPLENVIGKVFFRYYPFDKISTF